MNRGRWLLAAVALLWLVVLVRTAWLCDDAAITLRSVDHFVRGFGPRFNVDERVQAYTHPLWMLLLTGVYVVTRDGYWTLIGTGLAVSIAAAALLVRGIARTPVAAAIALGAWTLSRAAVDYSSGGLENPLSHLLVLAWLAVDLGAAGAAGEAGDRAARRKAWLLPAIAGLGCVTRHDLAVVFVPLVVGSSLRLWRERPALRRRVWIGVALGAAPLVLWTAFSLVYYGLPFPNPAYAKQFAGVERSLYLEHGVDYVRQTLRFDPLTAVVIAAALVGALVVRGARRPALAAALLLSVSYVVFVGGDFMRGRFLSVPFVLALGWLASSRLLERRVGAVAGALAILALGVATSVPPPLSGRDYGSRVPAAERMVDGIADERALFYAQSGLLAPANPADPVLRDDPGFVPRVEEGHEVVFAAALGFVSFRQGPATHVLDGFALADPLLARMPSEHPWRIRIGHLSRKIPDGYVPSLVERRNLVADPQLAQLYDHVLRITRGPLFTRERWRSIWLLNTGQLGSLIDPTQWMRPRGRARAITDDPTRDPPPAVENR
jgi:arabinofuranosyltransferase